MAEPTHSKKNISHACWFLLLEIAALFKFLAIYIAKLIEIHPRMERKFEANS
ncbi:MAG: hypothetical protein O7157_03460 [Wolbachia endosymbiont of Tetragnatha montana]|nr:hypothetical protein [Wolbachia endosymbiont of Tetragnatha montana]